MIRIDNIVSGVAGNETILVYMYLSDSSVPVGSIDILMKGIPISKVAYGEKWNIRLDSFDSVDMLYLVAYSIERDCTSQVYRFNLLSNSKNHFCPSSIDSVILQGRFMSPYRK